MALWPYVLYLLPINWVTSTMDFHHHPTKFQKKILLALLNDVNWIDSQFILHD